MAEVGYASLGIIPSFDGFERNLTRGATGPMTTAGKVGGTAFGDSAGKTAGSRFGGAFKTAAKASLIGLGALGVGAFKLAGDAVSAASDLEESTNKVRQVFGRGAQDIFKFTSEAADALGQSNLEARNAAATFGMFGNAAGLSDRKAAKFARRLTVLASDLASFHNTEPDEAINALGSALRGEAEPLRAYNVLLDESVLKAEALALGILKPVKDQAKIEKYHVAVMKGQKSYNDAVKEFGAKSLEALDAQADLGYTQEQLRKATEGTIPALTQQQKILAAESAIFKQTEVAQGDFNKTSEGLANTQRRLRSAWEDSKAELGKGLLPIMTQAANFLVDKGIPAFEKASDWFNDKGLPAIQDFGDGVKDAWGEVKKLAGFLNDLPDSGKLAALGAVVAGGVKVKGLTGGKLGGLTGTGGALGAPLKVFETNPAAMGGGGSGTGGVVGKAGKLATFASKGALPVTIVAWSSIALKDFHNFQNSEPRNPLGKGEFNRWWDRQFYDDGPVQGGNAWDKVRSNAIDAQTESEKALVTWKNFYKQGIKPVQDADVKVKITAPGLTGLLDITRDYKGILEGIPRRVVTEFVQNVTRNNTVEDIGGRGGKTPAGTNINIYGDIKPNDYDGFMSDLDRRRQRNELDGRRP